MIIYHGSTMPIQIPKILKNERMLDFGIGFYTTANKEQANRWAEIVTNRRETTTRVITEIELKVRELYNQTLFHTEKSLKFCRYLRHKIIGGQSSGKG
jgi:hypothetical protein